MKFKRNAFTLSEVLITLGIIGVVAALTIPVLIQNHKKQEASARLKKFYSMMNQAIMLSEIDNGPAGEWSKISYLDSNGDAISADVNRVASMEYFNKYLAKYMKYVGVDENALLPDRDSILRFIKIQLADGSSFYFKTGDCMDIRFDTNGEKKPNKIGSDIFTFLICPDIKSTYCEKKAFCPYGTGNAKGDRDLALSMCKSNGETCGTLLQLDNWEFKSDYPYKL